MTSFLLHWTIRSTTNTTWTDLGLNPGLCNDRPVSTHLSHGMAPSNLILLYFSLNNIWWRVQIMRAPNLTHAVTKDGVGEITNINKLQSEGLRPLTTSWQSCKNNIKLFFKNMVECGIVSCSSEWIQLVGYCMHSNLPSGSIKADNLCSRELNIQIRLWLNGLHVNQHLAY